MVQQVSPSRLKQMRDAGENPLVLDVREPWELERARLPGVVHIPMNEIPARIGELERGREIIVMCRSGGRSMQVAAYLERNGFARVANLDSGILGWARDVDPSVPTY